MGSQRHTRGDALDYEADLPPLPPGAFRAIELKGLERSSVWPRRETLRMKIVNVVLDKPDSTKSRYDALSYVWGPPPANQRVVVEIENKERTLFIYKNLYLALTSIWKNRVSGTSCLRLFVDQICINQEDKTEKLAQIKLMGKIYSQCTEVIVWLGPTSPGSSTFFRFADALCRREDGVVCETADLPPEPRGDVHGAVVEQCDPAHPDLARTEEVRRLTRVAKQDCIRFPLRAYADVLQRPWFGRLWIIQEAALAPSGVYLCGDDKLSFSFFKATFLFYCLCSRIYTYLERAAEAPMEQVVLRNDIFEFAAPFLRIGQERGAIRRGQREASLVVLVKKYNVNDDNDKVGASQPKDRILGLLGLLREADKAVEISGESAAAAYTQLAEREVKRNVDILLFAQRKLDTAPEANQPDKSLASLPSWVPDWSLPRMRTPHGYKGLTEEPLFAAGGPMKDEPVRIGGSALLRIRGLIVDRIAKAGVCQILHDKDGFLDYVAMKRFFDEIDLFLAESAQVRRAEQQDERTHDRLHTALCLTDGGCTPRQPADPGEPTLEQLYKNLQALGEMNLRAADSRDTYTSFWATWNRHSPGAYSWLPAFPPYSLIPYILMPLDAVMVLVVVAWMKIYLLILALRQSRIAVAVRDERDRIGGLDLRLSRCWRMTEYTDNIGRNRGRKLFLTTEGWVGLGPEHLEKGDVAVVLFGGSVPFVVRENEPKQRAETAMSETCQAPLSCRLVGEAYMPGLMGGEALAGGRDGNSTVFLIS